MSPEQALSWIVHETGHEALANIRHHNPAYLYGTSRNDLHYFENYLDTCSDTEYEYGAYYETYDQSTEETTIRYMQSAFVHKLCSSKLKAEKISDIILTNTECATGDIFRKRYPHMTPGFHPGNWIRKQCLRV